MRCSKCSGTEAQGKKFYRVVDGQRLRTRDCSDCLAGEARRFHRERKQKAS